jgi:DNA-binding response OmpR family regulator
MERPVKKILIVDDEPTLVATLRYNLESEGYSVESALDGESAVETARDIHPDLIILDIMLPGLDGLQVCRIMRRDTQAPILLLTAKVDEVDKVVGLELGADDYVTKPFSMRELMARVRALLRRAGAAESTVGKVIESGDLTVDTLARTAYRNGQPLTLKPKEFELLQHFMRHRGRAFSREELLSAIWGYDFAGDTRTVDVHISWLRHKIEDTPAKPTRLITVRGVGYRFEG